MRSPKRRFLNRTWVLFLLALVLVSQNAAAQKTVAADAIDRARVALNAGDGATAIAVLEALLREDPGAIEALDLLAKAYHQTGRFDEAQATTENILRVFPSRSTTRLWYAQFLEERRDFSRARIQYERVLQDTKAAPVLARQSRLGLGRVFLALGKPDQTLSIIAPLLAADPDGSAARLEIRALRRSGQLDTAIEAARRAGTGTPVQRKRLASLLHERGLHAYRCGDLETARRSLAETALLAPKPQVNLDLSRVLQRQNRPEDALRLLRRTARDAAFRIDVVEALVDALFAAGHGREALETVSRLLERDPASRPARLLELRCLDALDRDSEFRRRLEALAVNGDQDPDGQAAVFRTVGDLHRSSVGAEILLTLGVRVAPRNEAAWIHLLRKAGHRARKSGEHARACRFFREALRRSPEDPTIRQELGWAEFAAGNHDEALRLWQSELAAPAPSPVLLAAAARCLHASGRLDDALACTRRALAAVPDNSAIRRLYWNLLDESGLVDELVAALSPERARNLTDGETVALLNILTRRRGDPAVRAVIHEWLRKRPDDGHVATVAARVLRDDARAARAQGDLERAIALAGRAAALAPDAAWTHRDLASFLAASGAHYSALVAHRKAVRLDPGHARSRVRLIVALRAAGCLEEACEVIRAAPVATSTSPAFRFAAIEVFLAAGRAREAETLARTLIEDARARGNEKDVNRAYALLVTSLLKARQFDSAIETLEQRIADRPGDKALLDRYRVTCGWVRAGDRCARFLAQMRQAFPHEPAICSARAAHYLEREELDQAIGCLTRFLELRPRDLEHRRLLGDAELERGNPEAARKAYQKALSVSPTAKWAKIELANVELKTGNYRRALAICDEILAVNPWLQPARWTKVKAYERSGEHEAALRTWDSMLGFLVDEADHYFVRTRILYGAERFSEAKSELEKILARCRSGVLPILLYHGVSDDMQPATIHTERFCEHLRALRAAGYVTVDQKTVRDWLAGVRELPERAVMITFDDARLDNLVYADAALEEVGFNAIEFVPTARIQSRRSYHLSWEDLRDMIASGRWEVGAHGHEAHDRIPVGPSGSTSPFLAARRWVEDERRLETRDEFVKRIDTDYQRAREAFFLHLGLVKADYYSFTFNQFGQKDISNAPWIFPINDRAMQKHFRHGFHQSGGPYNIRSEDGNSYLTRLTVPPDWSGDTLVEYLRHRHPVGLAHLELGRLLSWRGDYNESFEHLDLAAQAGAAESAVLRARARSQMWQGDAVAASDTFRRLLDVNPDDVRGVEALERIERDRRPSAKVWFDFWWDNENRAIFGQTLRGELDADPRFRVFAEMRHATYFEKHVDDVPAWIPKIGAVALLGGPTEIAAALGHAFLEGADDQFEYDASVRWQGIDRFAVVGDVVGGPVQTASAIHDGVRLDAQSVLGQYAWTPDDLFVLSLRNTIYSDDNLRYTIRFRYTHRFTKAPALRIGYVGDYDDAREARAEYFTPDNQFQNLIYGQFDHTLAEKLTLSARLGGGYGVESDKGRFVSHGFLRFRWRLAENFELFGEATHQLNPDYNATLLNAGLDFRF